MIIGHGASGRGPSAEVADCLPNLPQYLVRCEIWSSTILKQLYFGTSTPCLWWATVESRLTWVLDQLFYNQVDL